MDLAMNENEIDRIAHAANALRPDWPVSSLRTLLGKPELIHKSRRDVAVALVWVACESKSKTPARVLESGPWWRAASVEDPSSLTPRPPKREEACDTCGRVESQHVGPWVGDHDFRPLAPRHYGADVRNGVMGDQNEKRAAAAAARMQLLASRESNCHCGVPRTHCVDHRDEEMA